MQTNGNQPAPMETSRNSPPGGPAGTVLALEGALGGGGAALLRDGAVAGIEAVAGGRRGRTGLFAAAEGVLARARVRPADVTALAVGTGPGSFTGLRVALAVATGVAAATRQRPQFFAADSLSLVVRGAGLSRPAYAAIPWGRRRLLVGRPGGEDVSLHARDALDAARLAGRTVAVPDALAGVEWPDDARIVRAPMPGIEALCALVLEGGAEQRGTRPPSPSYLAPPDAVLPVRASAASRAHAVTIVDARDVDALAALDAACFARPWSEDAIRDELEGEGRRVALGIRGEDGILRAAAIGRSLPGAFEIVRVAVAPGERRRGLARALVAALLDAARAAGAERVDLEVRATDDAAISLYARAGFVEVGRRAGYYGTGQDALLMSLVLARPA